MSGTYCINVRKKKAEKENDDMSSIINTNILKTGKTQ